MKQEEYRIKKLNCVSLNLNAEPGKWYRMKLDEIHDLETKTPVMGIIAYD